MKINSLSEQTFYIILSLLSEPLHGYGIIKKVEVMSNGNIVLAAGTLYGAIDNLKKSKLIEQLKTEDISKRKVYKLTEDGLDILMKEYDRLKQLCKIAEYTIEKREE